MSKRRVGSRSEVRDVAPLFAALGDGTRLRLVDQLCTYGPESIARLSASSPVSRQAITRHLEVLAAAGIVDSRRRGRERIWALRPKRLDEAHRFLDRLTEEWDDALQRLRRHVED